MIKSIIFDLGNVVVKLKKEKQYGEFSKLNGKSIIYIKKYIENSNLSIKFESGKLTPEQFHESFCKELNLNLTFDHFRKVWCSMFAHNKQVEKAIIGLKDKYRIILLSNTDPLHFPYIKSKFKILDKFDDFVLSYEVGCRKPNKKIFSDAIKKSKANPKECLYFDDVLPYVKAAGRLGIKSFQYVDFSKFSKDLKNCGILV